MKWWIMFRAWRERRQLSRFYNQLMYAVFALKTTEQEQSRYTMWIITLEKEFPWLLEEKKEWLNWIKRKK